MTYRRPGRSAEPTPRSPDIDVHLFAQPKGPLIVALAFLNAIGVMWAVWTCETGTAPRQLTVEAKIAFTVVTAAVLAGALIYHAVQERRMNALAAKLLAEDAAADALDGVAKREAEMARMRVPPYVGAAEADELDEDTSERERRRGER